MSSSWRRFEVLLPLQFNDGREVPPDWIAEAVLEIDVTDTSDNRQWLRDFKERWKVRLEQVDLWMISYPIEVED
jgi:hypothetical protein